MSIFEGIKFGQEAGKEEFDQRAPLLRVQLLKLQYQLRRADFPVIVVLAGDDRLGVNETLNLLHIWMDARYMEATAYGKETDEEKERPFFWRYWRVLPRQGRIGLFVRSWTTKTIYETLRHNIDDEGLERRVENIRRFEKALVDDGALVVKFWLHLPENELEKRLQAARKDPDQVWQYHDEDWELYSRYARAIRLIDTVLSQTDTREAPWNVVESVDSNYRYLEVGNTIREALEKRLQKGRKQSSSGDAPGNDLPSPGPRNALRKVDLSLAIGKKKKYYEKLAQWQGQLNRYSHRALDKGVSSVFVFEGWDAAGKGGIIRRLTMAMDAVNYRVVPISKPTEEEYRYHYLWRFWRHMPRAGHMMIFDRSWYGRLLVERIEGFATKEEWQRAYTEINDFETQLCNHGIVLMKFWIHIDKDEQLQRFQERRKTPFKKHKITEEDYRNRERWGDYEDAVNEMVLRTHTHYAPWHLVPGNDKRWARIEVLKTICRKFEKVL